MIIDSRQTALVLLRDAANFGSRSTDKNVDNQQNSQIIESNTSELAAKSASEALFSVNATNLTKAKLDLIDRTAEALGVKRDDYDNKNDFVGAMRKALNLLRVQQGEAAVVALEKRIGLDELDLSIDDIITSALDPDREDKVTEALKLKLGILSDKETRKGLVTVDAIGLYRISGGH